ncbi:MAG: hypothetical protein LH615_08120, partial [Ferruginibacter sp.]|nr:hypothetical protein [Ferruginibacter sp.]
MSKNNKVELLSITKVEKPFQHFYSSFGLSEVAEIKTSNWLHNTVHWKLSKTHFYEQFEFNLLSTPIPTEIKFLIQAQTIKTIVDRFKLHFDVDKLELVGVV